MFIIFILAFYPFAVWAQDNQLKPLPDVESLDLQTFVSQSNEISKTFEGDLFLAFDVQLPTTFVERDFDTLKTNVENDRLYGEVYRAKGPTVEDVFPYFTVQSIQLDRAISAKNWLVSKMLNEGQTLRSLEVHADKDEFEALYVRLDSVGKTEIVRAKGIIKGARIILAEYVLPMLLWAEQRDYQTYAIKSFEINGNFDNETIETMASYSHLGSFSMQYPQSWILDKEVKSDENRIDLSFKSADDLKVIFANIQVSVVSTKSLRDAVDKTIYPTRIPSIINARKNAVMDQGFLIGEIMERHTYDLAIETKLQVTEVYPLRKKLTDYVTHRQAPVSDEFWVTVIKGTEASGKSYILSMVVPSRMESLDNWALATKAYELMIESIR